MRVSKLTNNQLVALNVILLEVIFGALEGFLLIDGATPPGLELMSLLGLNIVMFIWVVRDSNVYSYHRSRLFMFCVVAFGILAIAFYLVRTRGLKRGLKGTALALALGFTSFLAYFLSWLIVYNLRVYIYNLSVPPLL